MGYTTEFRGKLSIEPVMKAEHVAYINKFSETRRMRRSPSKMKQLKLPDPLREAVELPVGVECCYFVGGAGFAGQDHDKSILDYNNPPTGQPSLWCQWEITPDGKFLQWNGAEKFYSYVEWLEYLITHFLTIWGYTLNGEMDWQGEDTLDVGVIVCKDNAVSTRRGEVSSRVDKYDVAGDVGFHNFLTYAKDTLIRQWEEMGGQEIGEREGDSLRELLLEWFGDKRGV